MLKPYTCSLATDNCWSIQSNIFNQLLTTMSLKSQGCALNTFQEPHWTLGRPDINFLKRVKSFKDFCKLLTGIRRDFSNDFKYNCELVLIKLFSMGPHFTWCNSSNDFEHNFQYELIIFYYSYTFCSFLCQLKVSFNYGELS